MKVFTKVSTFRHRFAYRTKPQVHLQAPVVAQTRSFVSGSHLKSRTQLPSSSSQNHRTRSQICRPFILPANRQRIGQSIVTGPHVKKELFKSFSTQKDPRDHRILGQKYELFMWDAKALSGNVFFLPHGTRVVNRLTTFLRNEYMKRGYEEVITPLVYNKQLWDQSGHSANYIDNMFGVTSREEAQTEYLLKPMNCPGHCLIFQNKLRSYRDLPIRFADFGILHRAERSGSLGGLTRLTRFTQDDAHIFCTQDQIGEEIDGCLDFIQSVYSKFDFDFSLELSTRPESFIGELPQWQEAEHQLEGALNKFKKCWKFNKGDGAFYGPKIDVHIKDGLQRTHQCGTIQLDFQLPKRFQLEYQTSDHHGKEPVLIHRAILGSVERMFAILLEHYEGKWPFWLSPRQVAVIPVSDAFNPQALEIVNKLKIANIHAEGVISHETLSKKVREAQMLQYNFIGVIGEKEAETNSISLRPRDGKSAQTVSLSQLEAYLREFER